jgi:hypothetical protein
MRTRIVRTRASAPVDLTAPTPPAAQSLAASATTASVTFTHPGAPGGTTYALTVTDEADAAVTPDSGSGLGAWVIPVASDKAYAATLTATGPDGQTSQSTALVMVQPDVASDFPIDGSAGWRTVFESNLAAEAAQGPVPAGASTLSLGGQTIDVLGSAEVGTFGLHSLCEVRAGVGLVLDLQTTNSQSLTCRLQIPVGQTLNAENSVRVRAKIRIYNEDTTDSTTWFVSDSSTEPNINTSSTAKTGGFRILNIDGTPQAGRLYARRGTAASAAVTPSSTTAAWAAGAPIYAESTIAAFANDVVLRLSESQFADPSPEYSGRSNSRDTSPSLTSDFFLAGDTSIKVALCVANGSSGTGTPYAVLEYLSVEVR